MAAAVRRRDRSAAPAAGRRARGAGPVGRATGAGQHQSYWTSPDKPPVVGQGEATWPWCWTAVTFGRTCASTRKDKPFQGLGYIGYDAAAKTFFSTWMDVNFTGLIVAKGGYDAAAGRYTFVGETPFGRSIAARTVDRRCRDDAPLHLRLLRDARR